jgi:hypothetical protein
MALRSPIYLDAETLLAQAEYHDIDIPTQAEIVEKTSGKRIGGGRAGVSGIGLDASRETGIERQSTYTLAPRQKATASKIVDSLIFKQVVATLPTDETGFSKDDLVEIEGRTRITAASLAGKMFFILRRLLEKSDVDLETVFDRDLSELPVAEQLKLVYLQNELLPMPVLLELTGSQLTQKVFVSVRSDHFIDAASANRIEGELRVLGSAAQLVPAGDEGYLSAEEWLLYDWEYLIRRKLMTQVDEIVKDMVNQLELDLPAEDVHAYIAGPAILVDAIALY